MRRVQSRMNGTTKYEFVPMPEQDIRDRLAAEADDHTRCYGLLWIDNVDVLGLLDKIEDLRRDNEALQAELRDAGRRLDRADDDPARVE